MLPAVLPVVKASPPTVTTMDAVANDKADVFASNMPIPRNKNAQNEFIQN